MSLIIIKKMLLIITMGILLVISLFNQAPKQEKQAPSVASLLTHGGRNTGKNVAEGKKTSFRGVLAWKERMVQCRLQLSEEGEAGMEKTN